MGLFLPTNSCHSPVRCTARDCSSTFTCDDACESLNRGRSGRALYANSCILAASASAHAAETIEDVLHHNSVFWLANVTYLALSRHMFAMVSLKNKPPTPHLMNPRIIHSPSFTI